MKYKNFACPQSLSCRSHARHLLTSAAMVMMLSLPCAGYAMSLEEENPLIQAADTGNVHGLTSLLSRNISLDDRGEFGTTALMRASLKGHTAIVQMLISKGADVDAADLGGATALHFASRQGHKDIVELLLNADAPLDATDENGWTPLMRSVIAKRSEIAELLVKKGADVLRMNRAKKSALDYAVQVRDLHLLETIIKERPTLEVGNAKITELKKLAEKSQQKELIKLVAVLAHDAPAVAAPAAEPTALAQTETVLPPLPSIKAPSVKPIAIEKSIPTTPIATSTPQNPVTLLANAETKAPVVEEPNANVAPVLPNHPTIPPKENMARMDSLSQLTAQPVKAVPHLPMTAKVIPTEEVSSTKASTKLIKTSRMAAKETSKERAQKTKEDSLSSTPYAMKAEVEQPTINGLPWLKENAVTPPQEKGFTLLKSLRMPTMITSLTKRLTLTPLALKKKHTNVQVAQIEVEESPTLTDPHLPAALPDDMPASDSNSIKEARPSLTSRITSKVGKVWNAITPQKLHLQQGEQTSTEDISASPPVMKAATFSNAKRRDIAYQDLPWLKKSATESVTQEEKKQFSTAVTTSSTTHGLKEHSAQKHSTPSTPTVVDQAIEQAAAAYKASPQEQEKVAVKHAALPPHLDPSAFLPTREEGIRVAPQPVAHDPSHQQDINEEASHTEQQMAAATAVKAPRREHTRVARTLPTHLGKEFKNRNRWLYVAPAKQNVSLEHFVNELMAANPALSNMRIRTQNTGTADRPEMITLIGPLDNYQQANFICNSLYIDGLSSECAITSELIHDRRKGNE